MLDKEALDKVDWDRLGYGGHLIRELLIGATSKDSEISTRALNNLENYLTPWPAFDASYGTPDTFKSALQNDIPQATVPFLLDILTDETLDSWVRSFVIEILHDMALYLNASKVYLRLHDPLDDIYRTRARAIRTAVERGIPIYQTLLNHADETLRVSAEDMLQIL
ncbi:MAG: hypothetical protein KF716_06385 [Anaerolineae bacterium]|nr:hypothetical protein [Anaerolineae bacterium]